MKTINNSLVELMQRLVLNHPGFGTGEIAGKLWGEDHLDSKRKKLCRMVNPYDDGIRFNPEDLPKLIDVLNERVPEDERATRGGDAIIHHLCLRAGLKASRPEGGQAGPVASSVKKMARLMVGLAEVDDGAPATSAVTMVLMRDGEEARAELKRLMSFLGSRGD